MRRGDTRHLRTILTIGFVAGTLDIGYVLIFYGLRGVPASRILKSIAAALLGRAAFDRGAGVAVLGLALHFGVALSVSAVFYLLSRHFAFMTRRPLASGTVYGIGVWIVMNALVLRFTATPPRSFPPPQWIPVFVAHIVCVGIPIAWLVGWSDARTGKMRGAPRRA